MAGMPNAHAAEAPAANDLAQNPTLIQEALTGAEREFVHGIGREVVTNIEDARSLVASPAIYVFWSVGLPTPYCPVIDGMRPGIAGLKGQAAGESAIQTKKKCVIGAGADVRFEIDRTKGIRVVGIWIELIQRAHSIAVPVAGRLGDPKSHRATRTDPHQTRANIRPGRPEVRGQFMIDGQTPRLRVK